MNNSWQHIRSLWKAAADKPRPSRDVVRVLRRHFAEPGIVERMARFERFIGETNATAHVWGVSDCSLVLADWAMTNGHADAADDLRGTYSTEDECRALVAARGGLSAVVGACAARVGLSLLHEPEFGSIAVVGSMSNADRQRGAIWNGHRWMVRWIGLDGQPTWAAFQAPVISMWRV